MGGVSTNDTTIYTTYSPCYHCFKKLAVGGVKRIVAGKIYRDSTIAESCRQANIEFILYEPSPDWLKQVAHIFATPIEEKTET
jgi:deoxycytidylate deaminase